MAHVSARAQGAHASGASGDERNMSEAAVRAAKVIKDIIFGVRANAEARRRFAPRYLVNSLSNLATMSRARCPRLDQRVRGGASRRRRRRPLARSQHRGAAAGRLPGAARRYRARRSAAAACRSAAAPRGWPRPKRAERASLPRSPDTRATWLVAESALDSAARDAFAGRTFWFRVANHHPWPWFKSRDRRRAA